MDREEALGKVAPYLSAISEEREPFKKINLGKELINKIYDDFESRTCENCIFALPLNLDKDKQYEFKCRLGHSDKLLNTVNKDFCCNKFERKES